jgi:peptidylprolyl isomerase
MARSFRIRFLAAFLLACMACGSAGAADGPVWREVDPDRLAFVETSAGDFAIELNPLFAPATVRQFERLVRAGFYDGLGFYRVIDGFVAQGGDGSDLGEFSEVPLIKAEFEIDWPQDQEWTPVQEPDLFAAETGLLDGFAVGRDKDAGKAWLTHCPGIVAMARNDGADTSRTDLYIVIGQAPRYLDRNMNVFGRVIHGMDAVQRIRRGPADENGIIQDDAAMTRIRSIKMAGDIPESERLRALVPDTGDKSFRKLLEDRRNRKEDFFHHKPPRVLDVCQVPVGGRLIR